MHECISEISTVITMVADNNVTTTSSDASKKPTWKRGKNNNNEFKSDPSNSCTWLEYKCNYFTRFRNGCTEKKTAAPTLVRRLTR